MGSRVDQRTVFVSVMERITEKGAFVTNCNAIAVRMIEDQKSSG